MSRELQQRMRKHVSLDDLAAMARAVIAHPSATPAERRKAERELRKIEAMRASKERAS